jgi:hypothetical protein
MFTAESIKLLAKDARRRTGRTPLHSVDQDDGRDGVKVGEGEPGSSGIGSGASADAPRCPSPPLRCALLLPPPAQSETWWSSLVFGSEDAPVSPQDAFLVLAHVAYRLGYARAVIGNPHIGLGTVDQLHEMLEALYGAPGWTALTACWHAAAGITRPARAHASITNRIPMSGLHPERQPLEEHLPQTGRTSPPSPASLQSEAEALRSLPGAVRRFWLYEPRVPAWRHQETAGEGQWRLDRESDGAWCG